MRMKGIIAVALWCMATMALSQTQEKLSFREAVKIGLRNNIVLNKSRNDLEYTQLNKTSSLLQMGPSVRASGSVYRNDGNSFNPQQGEVVNGVIDYVNGSLDAEMPIFTGLRMLNSHRQAASENEAQLHLVNRSSQDVIRDVASQYLTCLLDQQLVAIDEENVAALRVQYEQVKAQVELGTRAEADLYNQEYQVKNAELLLVRSRNKLKDDKALLAQTLLIDPAIPFDLDEVDWDVNLAVMDTLTVEEMMETAMTRRSDLRQAEELEDATRYQYSAMKGRYYPSVYAGVSYNSRYNYIHGADNRSFEEQFRTDNRQFGYGLSLNIPIYGGLAFRSQAAQARAVHKNAQLDTENTRIAVKTDIIRAYQNLRDAIASYEAADAQLRAAEITYRMEKERYDLGISDIVQLSVVNQTYIKAQADYQSARYRLMFQKLLVNHAMGTLKVEDIPESSD
ncbi:MAG TPA: TolC family protein [Cyclobacteriaceae bacterium]|nr:TolC family protein [Cyclobacteriaceae bacterium]